MKPYTHGINSARKWGGVPEDYQKIHDFLDQTKAHIPDMRHRLILHNSLGIFIAEQVFGINITNSEGKLVSVRDIAERHVLEDMGTIPSLYECMKDLPMYPWIGGPKRPRNTQFYKDKEELNAEAKRLREEAGRGEGGGGEAQGGRGGNGDSEVEPLTHPEGAGSGQGGDSSRGSENCD